MTGQEMMINTVVSGVLKSLGISREEALGKLASIEHQAKGVALGVMQRATSIDERVESIDERVDFISTQLAELTALVIRALRSQEEMRGAVFNGVVPAGDTYEPSLEDIKRAVEMSGISESDIALINNRREHAEYCAEHPDFTVPQIVDGKWVS